MISDFNNGDVTLKNEIGERLKELRHKSKLTQEQVGSMLGKTKSAINLYESGKNEPPIDVIGRLASIYNSTSDYILNRSVEKVIFNTQGLNMEQKEILVELNMLFIDSLRLKHGGQDAKLSLWSQIKETQGE